MRIPSAERECALIHLLRERFDAAGVVAREATRDIVGTFHEKRAQQIDPLINIPRFNVELHRLSQGIGLRNRDRSVEPAAFRDN